MKSGYFKNYYKDKTEDEIKASIKKEGFRPIGIYNTAGYEYLPHQHKATKILAFIEGTMEVQIGSNLYQCSAYDRIVIEGGAIHRATVGSNGCEFFWAEKVIAH